MFIDANIVVYYATATTVIVAAEIAATSDASDNTFNFDVVFAPIILGFFFF